MRRLVESWIEAEREHYGNTLGKAIEKLNADRGMKVNYSRASEWRRGVYVPNPVALSWMLARSLPWMLKKAGLESSPETLDRLRDLLWVREIKDGKRLTYYL